MYVYHVKVDSTFFFGKFLRKVENYSENNFRKKVRFLLLRINSNLLIRKSIPLLRGIGVVGFLEGILCVAVRWV